MWKQSSGQWQICKGVWGVKEEMGQVLKLLCPWWCRPVSFPFCSCLCYVFLFLWCFWGNISGIKIHWISLLIWTHFPLKMNQDRPIYGYTSLLCQGMLMCEHALAEWYFKKCTSPHKLTVYETANIYMLADFLIIYARQSSLQLQNLTNQKPSIIILWAVGV